MCVCVVAERKMHMSYSEEKLRQVEEKKKEDKERYLRESQRVREEMAKEKVVEKEPEKNEKIFSYVPPHMRKK